MTRSTHGTAAATALPSPKERRRLREAKSLSEEQVAAAVGVTRATVRSWETGRSSPRGRRREAYARVIGVAPEPRPAPRLSAEATGSSTMSPTEPCTGVGTDAGTDAQVLPEPAVPASPEPRPTPTPEPRPTASPEPRPTAEQAFDVLYERAAPGLIQQTYLLTGRRNLSREAVERAFHRAWHRWPEVARDRDPAGWVRAAAYEYAMSPWHRLRRDHRHADALPEEPGRRALLGALLDLPPSYRRTLLLYDGVGLDLPETAAETEASTVAAANRLMNARAAIAERLPGIMGPASPGGQSTPLHEELCMLVTGERLPTLPAPRAVRTGGERTAQLWTRAAGCFAVVLIGLTGITLHTAPTRYEQPLSPAQRVSGVPARSGPQKLTPQDLQLQKSLRSEFANGPERLVPQLP